MPYENLKNLGLVFVKIPLRNQAKFTVGIDFAVVRTISFRAIFVFIAISHNRRKILHFAVSSKPHSQLAIQQLRKTFAFDETTKYIIKDNDKIFSEDFKQQIKNVGLKEIFDFRPICIINTGTPILGG